MSLWSMTVVLGQSAMSFTFKSAETAKKATDVLAFNGVDAHQTTGIVVLTDDYGQTAMLRREAIIGYVLDDMDKSGDAAVERGVHQAKLQIKGQTKMAQDPAVRFSMGNGMGPQIGGPRLG